MRIAQDLKAALDYNRLLIEVCPIGVIVYKENGDNITANPAAASIVGATTEQLKSQNFRDIDSWKKSGFLSVAEHSLATNTIEETEIHLNPSSFGKNIWLSVRLVPFKYNSEQHLLLLFSDITQKKAIEEQNRIYAERLETSLMQAVEAITALNAMRDPYTADHGRRVAEIAVAIGRELDLDSTRLQGLRIASCLHDVGKINIPAEILAKPRRLSAAEFALVKEHSRAGYEVLKKIDFPWPVATFVLQHHERYDGSGYPSGLSGEEIALEARIIAVADVVESMSSHRPYRAALGIEKALAEIEHGRGTAFDPNAVDACLRLFRDKHFQVPA